MLNMGTAEDRIISAAMRLAADRPWQEITLREIAEAAGMSLAGLSEHYSSKADVLRGFVKAVDKEVLVNAPAPQPGETRRDALFEVLMARFDILEPYKPALKSIVRSGETELALIGSVLQSQGWMLQAAGVDSGGPSGALKTAGLASVYASGFRTWLEDDDPGLARTMAVLDRQLRRGESVMSGVDSAIGAVRRVADVLRSGFGNRRSDKHAGPDDDAAHDDVPGAGGGRPEPGAPAAPSV